MKTRFTSEKHIQMLISLLKEYGVKRIIASPGTTNINFVASVLMDDYFDVHSCVDERSAAYMACGMAAQTNEPVVIVCTGATASRNYLPGLTEAYYRKLPIVAITATQHLGKVGQNIAQVIDRSVPLNDIVKTSIQLSNVYSEDDIWSANLKINCALQELSRNGGGPIHINLVTSYSNEFTYGELPVERKINRITKDDIFPNIESKRVAIFIGNHSIISNDLQNEIEEFCEKYNGIVLCDHTSNYNGKYKLLGNIICSQEIKNGMEKVDLLIDFGNISGAYLNLEPKRVWRICEDSTIRDTYKKIEYNFEMSEIFFFKKYNSLVSKREESEYYNYWFSEINRIYSLMDDSKIPFSNIWVSKKVIEKIREDSIIHLAVLNTLRSWNYFNTDKKLNVFCNTGGFGIDGIVSTALGASLVSDKNVFCFVGDLAFFYDLNSIGNRELKNNLRILIINNGTGTEFHNYSHRATTVSKVNNIDASYFAADGHFGNKSSSLVRHYSEDLGFNYFTANSKESFEKIIDTFLFDKSENPIVLEVFTNSSDESNALEYINSLNGVSKKQTIKKIIGEENLNRIKKVIGR